MAGARYQPLRPRTRTRVEGSLALVTGSGNGIGRETALELSRRGAHVLVADVDLVAAEQTAAECGGTPYEIDVADLPSRVVDRISSLTAEMTESRSR